MKLEAKNLIIAMLFIAFLAMAGIAQISQQDAGFYCQNYCEAKSLEFVHYKPGECRCSAVVIDVNESKIADYTYNN